jgi:hypothetical protein
MLLVPTAHPKLPEDPSQHRKGKGHGEKTDPLIPMQAIDFPNAKPIGKGYG